MSLYRRKKAKQSKEKDPEELTTMITNATIDMKEEPVDEEEPFGGGEYLNAVLNQYFKINRLKTKNV